MIGKHFIETSNKVELRINRVRINRSQPVVYLFCRTASNIPITLEKMTTVSRFYSMWTLAGDERLKVWKPSRCKSVQLRHVSSLSVP